MTVLQIKHLDRDGECLWEEQSLPNVLHQQGEEFILKSIFDRASGVIIPESFYIGLDNRTTLNLTDTLSSLVAEPIGSGYTRQSISSNNGFSIKLNSLNWILTSRNIMFHAVGGSWGPVRNVFLSNASANSGFLISSVSLKSFKTIGNGQIFSLQIALGIRN